MMMMMMMMMNNECETPCIGDLYNSYDLLIKGKVRQTQLVDWCK